MDANQCTVKPTPNHKEAWREEGRKEFVHDFSKRLGSLVPIVGFYCFCCIGLYVLVVSCVWSLANFGLLAFGATGIGFIVTLALIDILLTLKKATTKEEYVSCVKSIWWCLSFLIIGAVLFAIGALA